MEAKILHIEDSELFRQCVDTVLAVRGIHKVVAWAETYGHALNKLDAIKARQSDPNVANIILLDSYLGASSYINQPKLIIAKMKELELDLPVVGLSGDGLADRGLILGRDFAADLKKDELCKDTQLLDRVLDGLEPIE